MLTRINCRCDGRPVTIPAVSTVAPTDSTAGLLDQIERATSTDRTAIISQKCRHEVLMQQSQTALTMRLETL